MNKNQDKATKPQTVQIVRQGEATLYWFKFNPLYYPVCGLVLRFVNLICIKKSPIDDSYNINIKEYRYIGDSHVLFFNQTYVRVSGADNGVFCRLCLFDGGTARLCGASA
ncbi:hypothetical protein FGF65_07150 [Neisseria meningitidis]|nr:hypothetical protein [Neisseria meningitidis]